MLGYGPEEIKTLGVADIHPEQDLPRVIDQFERQQRREIAVAESLPPGHEPSLTPDLIQDIQRLPRRFQGHAP